MNRIRELHEEEIENGIVRCNARLSGIMPMGWISEKRVQEALEQYKKESERRRKVRDG